MALAIRCCDRFTSSGYADRIYTTKRASFLAALKDAIDRCRWGQATATVLCPPGPDHDQMPQMAERLVNIAALLLRLRDPALTGDMLEFMLPVVDAMPAADRVLRPKEQAWIAAKEAAWAAEDPHTRKRKHRIDLALWINKQLAKARAASQDAETAAAHKAAVFKDCTALAALVGFGCDTTVNYMRKLPRPFWELDGMLCSVALMLQNAAQCAPESAMIGGSARGGGAPQLVRRLLEETDISAKWMAYFHAAPMNGRGVRQLRRRFGPFPKHFSALHCPMRSRQTTHAVSAEIRSGFFVTGATANSCDDTVLRHA